MGTTSVESSELLSSRLKADAVRRLLQTTLVRKVWMDANQREEEGRLIPELQQFNEPLEKITPDSLRKFIQPFGITNINLEEPSNLPVVLDILRLDDKDTDRLKKVIQGGVPHQVLNARKHTEESQIIAGAGAFGAVTIATNMAGRGVDIKLGGELAEEVITAVNRVLGKAGHENTFDMTQEERRAALKNVDPSSYGIYEAEFKLFLQYFEDMERVKELGGELLRSRRSVRRFRPQPVARPILDRILETACWAPSAHHRQPWRFVVVETADRKVRLADRMGERFRADLCKDQVAEEEIETRLDRSRQRILNAPVVIILCLDEGSVVEQAAAMLQQAEELRAQQGVALAGGVLLNAAHLAGLAGVWMCAPLFSAEECRLALDFPDSWQPQGMILLGYPASTPEARRRRPLAEVCIFR